MPITEQEYQKRKSVYGDILTEEALRSETFHEDRLKSMGDTMDKILALLKPEKC